MRLKKSIFTKLIGSFILYVVILFFTFAVYLLLEAVLIGEGNPANLYPYQIIDENGNVAGIEILQKMGGWVEELEEGGREGQAPGQGQTFGSEQGQAPEQDQASGPGQEQGGIYQVIRVYGEKKSGGDIYSAQDLLELTSPYGETAYIGFFVQPENSPRKFLCFYDRTVVQVNAVVNLNYVDGYGVPDIFILFFPSALLEILLICFYLKRKIKNPLDRIVAGMEDLKSGNTGARIDIKTEAEFEKIVDTFNLMAQQLEDEKAQKELLIRKKNQMLLELSHDIRTPIATIKSYANALEAGLVPKERIESVYRTIDRKADRVEKLSGDMFMMLKMDNPDYELRMETVNLCELLRQLCVEYYDEITEAGFDFVIDIPDREIPVSADVDLLSRVISNLLSNALRYNKSGKVIAVSVSGERGKALLSVSDDGEEVDRAFAGQMFHAFSRGDFSRKTDGGTGLGLAISRIIMEKHGGSIGYCRRDGKNVFEAMLPAANF